MSTKNIIFVICSVFADCFSNPYSINSSSPTHRGACGSCTGLVIFLHPRQPRVPARSRPAIRIGSFRFDVRSLRSPMSIRLSYAIADSGTLTPPRQSPAAIRDGDHAAQNVFDQRTQPASRKWTQMSRPKRIFIRLPHRTEKTAVRVGIRHYARAR